MGAGLTTARRTAGAVALVAAVSLGLGACSGGDDQATTTTTVAPGSAAAAAALLPPYDAQQQLPPNDVGSLRALYDPALAELGLHLTRAELIDVSFGGYSSSNDGRHLALYVEPTGDYTVDDYVTGYWKVAALMTPDVFGRWPELESYDICQEPLPSVDNRAEPFPETQIDITRAAAANVDWSSGSVVDLLVASRRDPDVRLTVAREVRNSQAYSDATAAAAEITAADSTTTTTVPAFSGSRNDDGSFNNNGG